MSDSTKWHRYLRFWRPNIAADVDDEVAFHIDARTEELRVAGVGRDAARAQALREFGDVARTRETLRTMDERHASTERRLGIASDLARDVKVAFRALRRSPGLVAIVVLTFALGIGATSAIYSIVDAFMFRPLPGSYGADLVVLARTEPGLTPPHELSFSDYTDFRADTATFASLAAYEARTVELQSDRGAERLLINDGTANYFSTLGLPPMLGRTFAPNDDDGALAHPVIVLSYKAWVAHFDADSSVVGRVIRINERPVTVIGVMPPQFHGVQPIVDIDGVVPMNQIWPAMTTQLADRGVFTVNVFGRLRPGVSMSAARREVSARARQLERAYPATNKNVDEVLVPEHFARPSPAVSRQTPVVAGIFMTLVTLVLIVACANVASVLLARVVARGRELAIRAAMGASTWRVVRPVFVECALLALTGGVASIGVAYVTIRALSSIRVASDLPIRWGVQLDGRVAAFTAIATLVASVVAAVAPVLAARRRNLNDVLKSGASGAGGSTHQRARAVLVVAQVAVSVVVLICAGLFITSAARSMHMNFGFRTDHLAMLTTELPPQRYDTAQARVVYQRVLAGTATLPGVRSTALAAFVPFGFERDNVTVFPIDAVGPVPSNGFSYFSNIVSTDYFATMGIPVLHGRAFTDRDDATAPLVIVVNDSLARAIWPRETAIGKRVHLGTRTGEIAEIVGVVGGMQDLIPGERPKPYVFRPLGQAFAPQMTLLVHTSSEPAALLPALRRAIVATDPTLAVYDTRTIRDHLRDGQALLFTRIGSAFAIAFGLLALVLATVGVYGVVAYSVAQRTREIGVRVALGAHASSIMRLVIGQGVRLAGIGAGIGLLVAMVATGALGAILYGVSPRDPVVLSAVICLVLTVAAAATLVPALRAMRVDPVRALKAD